MWMERCNLVLNILDGLEEQRPLSIPEFNFRNIVKRRIANLLHYKCIYWKNRCTIIRWVKLRGENTKFFMPQPPNLTEEIKFPHSPQMTASPTMNMNLKRT
jgi:hypothetical protein